MKNPTRFAMQLSLGAAVLMLVGKLSAYFLTGSTAILSDAAESVVHIIATIVAAIGLFVSTKPADKDHLYGHGKIVAFSVGLEGSCILGAALYIILEAGTALVLGPKIQHLGVGILITGLLGTINFVLGRYLIRVGKRERCPPLIANGQHVLTDMYTSYAVVLGVAVVWLTDIVWLDPLIAILAAMQILNTGWSMVKTSFHQTMEHTPPEETDRIQQILDDLKLRGEVTDYHQLRHRQVNNIRWIEVHIQVPGHLSVVEAHKRVSCLDTLLNGAFPDEYVYVTSHIEPDKEELAHPDGRDHEADDPLC